MNNTSKSQQNGQTPTEGSNMTQLAGLLPAGRLDPVANSMERSAQLSVMNDPDIQFVHHSAAETAENVKEIRNIDGQIDRLNTCLDRVEKTNDELHEKIQSMLDQQRQARMERKESLSERNKQNEEGMRDFHSQIHNLLSASRTVRTVPYNEREAQMEDDEQPQPYGASGKQ